MSIVDKGTPGLRVHKSNQGRGGPWRGPFRRHGGHAVSSLHRMLIQMRMLSLRAMRHRGFPPTTCRLHTRVSASASAPAPAQAAATTAASFVRALAVRPQRVLGVETSCDDTALAVVDTSGRVLSHACASQWQLFDQHAGIMPKAASAAHAASIEAVYAEVLRRGNLRESDLDGVAATSGPGLDLCLRVGLPWASALAQRLTLPFIGVHHMQAHAFVAQLDHPHLQTPFVALLISGGHTELWLVHSQSRCNILAQTADDAVGEAYDKCARSIGVVRQPDESPGAAVERLAAQAKQPRHRFKFTRLRDDNFDFSFAGLKASVQRAVLQLRVDAAPTPPGPELHLLPDGRLSNRSVSLLVDALHTQHVDHAPLQASATALLAQLGQLTEDDQQDLCAAFQLAVCEQLTSRVQHALDYCDARTRNGTLPIIRQLVVGGGVACNSAIRAALSASCSARNVEVLSPRPLHCMDNGIMIAHMGARMLQQGHTDALDLTWHPRWPIGPRIKQNSSAQQMRNNAQISNIDISS